MAIKRNAEQPGGGKRIKDPGEYIVKVMKASMGLTKKKEDGSPQKPMLTVTFQTRDEKEINGYFVKDNEYAAKAMQELKSACGIAMSQHHENLIGKDCGILVEQGNQNPKGSGFFMRIVGYGPASEVTGADAVMNHEFNGKTEPLSDTEVPF